MEKTKTISKISIWWAENKNLVLKILAFTFGFGLLAHAYGFLNLNLSHDYLSEFQNAWSWKIQIGRFLNPLVRFIFAGPIILPWLEGMIATFFIAIAVYLVCRILDIKNTIVVAIVSAVFITNITITSTVASYMGDMVTNTISLIFSCLIVFHYKKHKANFKLKDGAIICFYVIMVSGGYQAYISLTLVLLIFDFVLSLLKECDVWKEVLKVVYCVASLVVGLFVYLGIANLIGLITGYGMGGTSTNDLSNLSNFGAIFGRMPGAVKRFFTTLFCPFGDPKSTLYIPSIIICIINVLLVVATVFVVIKLMISKKLKPLAIVWLVVAAILIPFACEFTYILSGSHTSLSLYAYWAIYPFVFKVIGIGKETMNSVKFNWVSKIAVVFMFAIILSNISLANTAYIKKDVEAQSTLAIMTSITNRIEDLEDYKPGETKVVFVGSFGRNHYLTSDINYGYNFVEKISGMDDSYAISYWLNYDQYYDKVLQYEMNVERSLDIIEEYTQKQEVADMPCYPNNGFIKVIDGVVVVKISNENRH